MKHIEEWNLTIRKVKDFQSKTESSFPITALDFYYEVDELDMTSILNQHEYLVTDAYFERLSIVSQLVAQYFFPEDAL